MIPLPQFKEILGNNDKGFIETLAQNARAVTLTHFGRTVSLYAPLYLANFCDNHCVYCGFNRSKSITRKKLSIDEIRREMQEISATGIQSILLLTGESRGHTPLDYIKTAIITAKDYFAVINLEVYPMEVEEYRELFAVGADGVTIYQETYDNDRYTQLHLAGKKSDYDYRYRTPERIAQAGMRMLTMGVLLGLSDPAPDVYRLFLHLEQIEKKYPGLEYALSFPRLIPIEKCGLEYYPVPDVLLIKLICLARILFPRVGINLSTRERPYIRDHALLVGVTKMSAASRTTVGGYSQTESKDPQFEVMDNRSVAEIVALLRQKGYDPVFTDWRRIDNIDNK